MKKKAFIFIFFIPFIYIYGICENHFCFNQSIRGLTLELYYEYLNAWRVLFNKNYVDYSNKISDFEYKLKSKKAKIDYDITFTLKKFFSETWVKFDNKKKLVGYYYSSDYGRKILEIKNLDKNKYQIKYYNDSSWNKKESLNSDYIFTKNQVIDIINSLYNKDR